jgi:beta-glucuronidase
MRSLALLCVSAFFTLTGASAAIENVSGRKTTSLNGTWRAIVDPYEVGYIDYRYQPLGDNSFGANRKPKTKSDREEYDFDTSPTLLVPGDWNTQRPELFFYEGTIWYKRDFDYSLLPGHRLFLHFGAANYSAVVFVNGKKIGGHTGGFTPFEFEITSLVKPTGNFVIVKVDNQRKKDAVPTVNTDWWNYGGLTRDVLLIDEPATFVEDYLVQLEKGSRTRIAGWVQLNGERRGQQVRIRIPEAQAETTVTTDTQGRASFALDAKLQLWSPQNPKLYDVSIQAGTDQVTDQIGFRTIETRGADILLNGQPIFLKGVSIHAEAPYRTGRAFSVDDARTLFGWVQELHGNFARLAHYPHAEAMPRLADRLGILLWEEVPVYWTIQWENPETYRNAETQLRDLIARDKNRAAVILWSVSNETPVLAPRTAFLRNLASAARASDSTRLVTAALERHYTNATTQMIDDPLGDVLDVVGCNEYLGWYDGTPDKIDTIEWKLVYNKPLIFSEFGAGALQGFHADDQTMWSEEYQKRIYEKQTAMFRRIPFLRGTTPWVLMDFRSPRRLLPGVQDYFNRKGLVSERGQKKAAFDVLRQYYDSVR